MKFLLVALLLAACSAKVDQRGYVLDENWKEQVTVGTTTREEVRANLGSPSSESNFGEESWYYINARKEAVGPLKPEITDQEVVKITFDSGGVVSGVQTYDKEAGKQIAIVSRETPTEGHSLGFFEQLLGNVGRFNSPGKDNSIAPGRRPGGGF